MEIKNINSKTLINDNLLKINENFQRQVFFCTRHSHIPRTMYAECTKLKTGKDTYRRSKVGWGRVADVRERVYSDGTSSVFATEKKGYAI